VLGVYNMVHGRRAFVSSLCLKVFLHITGIMSDLYPLGSRCIDYDPLYGDAPDLAVVRNWLVHILNPQMKEVAYRRWFVVYGVTPADVCHMVDSGVIGTAPRYHPCGKLSAVEYINVRHL